MNTRQLNVLKYLLKQNDYVTAKEISKNFQVTPKTIYLDVKLIQEQIKEYDLNINKKTNCGIFITGKEENKQRALLSIDSDDQIFNENSLDLITRRKKLVINIVLLGKLYTLQQLSEKYYVSKTSILNDIEYINKTILSNYHVHIATGTDKKISVTGLEENIQLAMINAFMNSLLNSRAMIDEIFETKIITAVKKLSVSIENIDLEDLADYYIQALEISLMILLTRIQQGFHIRREDYFFLDNLDFIKNYPLASDIAHYLEKELPVVFTDQDKTILSKYLTSYRVSSIHIKTDENTLLIDLIIKRLEEAENIRLLNKDELRNQLLLHIPAMVLRLKNGIKIKNPLLDEVKSRYLHLFTLSWYVLSVVEERYAVTLTEDEISFIAIYFQMTLNKSHQSKHILVVCPYGVVSSKYVVNLLRNLLPRFDDIQSCSYGDLNSRKIEDVDLIVSTSSKEINTLVPVVHVSPMLDDVDCSKIFEAYANNIFLKKTNASGKLLRKNRNLTELSKYLTKELMFFKMKFDTKDQCLDFIIKKLESRNSVTAEFKQSVYQREKIGSPVLENGIAIPHGLPTYVNEFTVVFVTLEKAIKWSDQYVDMVIMVVSPESEINAFEGLIMELYHISTNVEVLNGMKSIKNYEEYLSKI